MGFNFDESKYGESTYGEVMVEPSISPITINSNTKPPISYKEISTDESIYNISPSIISPKTSIVTLGFVNKFSVQNTTTSSIASITEETSTTVITSPHLINQQNNQTNSQTKTNSEVTVQKIESTTKPTRSGIKIGLETKKIESSPNPTTQHPQAVSDENQPIISTNMLSSPPLTETTTQENKGQINTYTQGTQESFSQGEGVQTVNIQPTTSTSKTITQRTQETIQISSDQVVSVIESLSSPAVDKVGIKSLNNSPFIGTSSKFTLPDTIDISAQTTGDTYKSANTIAETEKIISTSTFQLEQTGTIIETQKLSTNINSLIGDGVTGVISFTTATEIGTLINQITDEALTEPSISKEKIETNIYIEELATSTSKNLFTNIDTSLLSSESVIGCVREPEKTKISTDIFVNDIDSFARPIPDDLRINLDSLIGITNNFVSDVGSEYSISGVSTSYVLDIATNADFLITNPTKMVAKTTTSIRTDNKVVINTAPIPIQYNGRDIDIGAFTDVERVLEPIKSTLIQSGIYTELETNQDVTITKIDPNKLNTYNETSMTPTNPSIETTNTDSITKKETETVTEHIGIKTKTNYTSKGRFSQTGANSVEIIDDSIISVNDSANSVEVIEENTTSIEPESNSVEIIK